MYFPAKWGQHDQKALADGADPVLGSNSLACGRKDRRPYESGALTTCYVSWKFEQTLALSPARIPPQLMPQLWSALI